MSNIKAYYTDRKGASCMRVITNDAEAEKIMRGGYGARDVMLMNDAGDIVGRRYREDGLDDRRMKYTWWFERDLFPTEVSQ